MGNGSSREDDTIHTHTVEMMTTNTESWIPGYEDKNRGYLGTAAIVYLTTRQHGTYNALKQGLLAAHGLSSSEVKRIRISYTLQSSSTALFEITTGTPLADIITSDKVKFVFRVLEYHGQIRKAMQSHANNHKTNDAEPHPDPLALSAEDIAELEAITRSMRPNANNSQTQSALNVPQVRHYDQPMRPVPNNVQQMPNFDEDPEHYKDISRVQQLSKEIPQPPTTKVYHGNYKVEVSGKNANDIPDYMSMAKMPDKGGELPENDETVPTDTTTNEIPNYMSSVRAPEKDEGLTENEDLEDFVEDLDELAATLENFVDVPMSDN